MQLDSSFTSVITDNSDVSLTALYTALISICGFFFGNYLRDKKLQRDTCKRYRQLEHYYLQSVLDFLVPVDGQRASFVQFALELKDRTKLDVDLQFVRSYNESSLQSINLMEAFYALTSNKIKTNEQDLVRQFARLQVLREVIKGIWEVFPKQRQSYVERVEQLRVQLNIPLAEFELISNEVLHRDSIDHSLNEEPYHQGLLRMIKQVQHSSVTRSPFDLLPAMDVLLDFADGWRSEELSQRLVRVANLAKMAIRELASERDAYSDAFTKHSKVLVQTSSEMIDIVKYFAMAPSKVPRYLLPANGVKPKIKF